MNADFLNQIKSLSQDAIFGLISDSYKEAYISHTTNLKSRIGVIIDDLNLRDDTKLVIFCDSIQDHRYKLIFTQYYVDKYKMAGYNMLGGGREYINYKVVVHYSKHLDSVFVVLKNRRKDKLIVGVFRQVEEANSFVAQYYREEIIQPVYAINRETRVYINSRRSSESKN